MNLREAKELVREKAMLFYQDQTPPYTFVRIGFSPAYGEPIIMQSGYAKLHPGRDIWNSTRGIEVAIGHATADIARQLVKEG